MLKKYVTFLVISAILVFTIAPGNAFAQTVVRTEKPRLAETSTAATSTLKPEVKEFFAKELSNAKSFNAAEINAKNLGKESRAPAKRQGWSKHDKTFLILFSIGLAALVTVLIITPYKGPTDCNEPRPKDPASCQILFGNN